MKEVRFFYVPDAATQTELPQEEATHALRVLRIQAGDELFLMDGKGVFYRAEVSLATNKRCIEADFRSLLCLPGADTFTWPSPRQR